MGWKKPSIGATDGARGLGGLFTDVTGSLPYKYEIITPENQILLKSDPYAFQSELRPNTASLTPKKILRIHGMIMLGSKVRNPLMLIHHLFRYMKFILVRGKSKILVSFIRT